MARIDETFFAADLAAWRAWLAAHHGERREVWLLLHKKHVTEPCVSSAPKRGRDWLLRTAVSIAT